MPNSPLYAQSDYQDPTEVFWGDDEYADEDTSGYFEDDEYYDEDTTDYYEDDEYYEDDTSDYGADDEYYDDEYDGGEEELSDIELADVAKQLGYSLNISGASPGFVSYGLANYNNNPQVNFRLSIEFPLLLQFAGVRFRFGAEFGNFGFENFKPVGGKFSGVTAMGLLAFPAGPGKLKVGAGLVGSTLGVTGESSYGFAIGNTLELRGGIRYTGAFGVKDTNKLDMGYISWIDGLIMLGFNL